MVMAVAPARQVQETGFLRKFLQQKLRKLKETRLGAIALFLD